MADDRYYVGHFRQDGQGSTRGWFVGSFIQPDGSPRRTPAIEVKHWRFDKLGRSEHDFKREPTKYECTLILKGRVKAYLDGRFRELGAGHYVVIPPGVDNNTVVEILEQPAEGIRIKAPSDGSDKEVLPSPT